MTWRVLQGDCIEQMAAMPVASVDAVVCDPPYNLTFMSKGWDRFDGREDAATGYWLAGLIDGEGYFGIKAHARGTHAPTFQLKMRADEQDGLAQARRAIGGIGTMRRERRRDANDMIVWTVGDREGCQRLADLLDKYPLRLKKRQDYLVWREAVCEWTARPRGNRWRGATDNSRMESLRDQLAELRSYRDPAWSGHPFQDWCRLWGEQALRVLKPGGHCLAFGGTRTSHRLVAGLEDAGFEIRDTVAYLYGSGFPKSLDVSKAIDKAAGAERETVGPRRWNGRQPNGGYLGLTNDDGWVSKTDAEIGETAPATPEAQQWEGWGTALKPAHEPIVVARKPLIGTVSANVLAHGTGALNVDGCRIEGQPVTTTRNTALGRMNDDGWQPTPGSYETPAGGRWPANVVLDEQWIPVLCLRDTLDSDLWEVLAEWCDARHGDVPTVRGRARRAAEPGEADEVLLSDVLRPMAVGEPSGRGSPDGGSPSLARVDSEDAKDQAGDGQEGDGQSAVEGELPKPGLPLHQSVGAKGEAGAPDRNGGGSRATSEAGGIGASHQRRQDGQPAAELRGALESGAHASARGPVSGTARVARPRREVLLRDVPARWLRFFDFTGDVARTGAAELLDAQTGDRAGSHSITRQSFTPSINGPAAEPGDVLVGYADTGGASRFFYVAKASRSERNAGLDGFERAITDDGRNTPIDNPYLRGETERQNTHPTVKPIALMRWLVRLVTPPGGTVLDPFTGSGTTGIAAVLEGFDLIGIEREAEYVAIAEARIAFWAEHGEEGLRIVRDGETAEAKTREIADLGQLDLFGEAA